MKLNEISQRLTPLLSWNGHPETVKAAELALNLIDAVSGILCEAIDDKEFAKKVEFWFQLEGLETYGKDAETFGVRFKEVKEK